MCAEMSIFILRFFFVVFAGDETRLTFKGHSDTSIYVSTCISVGIDHIIGERLLHSLERGMMDITALHAIEIV